ncbi:hypothetical protein [Thiomicrorhabdus sediminis]|uniref:Proteins of 100 residues with WXG n=1 Tax=Thiomicrorhabdus sediminis TaxID=2580412 RepID=A0A4P9K6F5_9GAMM|nr:hypothetical protein [Thiomicrorhabdus sediminis]QCU90458.1 hypothetical protein FE785_07350 [Thiomicrorhabdus sediminis]
MSSLQQTRLNLLTHSKNMLNASLDHEWQRYNELDSVWLEMLENASKEFGEQLDDIGAELMSDNEKIRENIQRAQQSLLSELEKETQKFSSVKSYLK